MVKVKSLQSALQLAGKQHNYQIGLILVLCLLFFQVNFILFGPSYIFINPTFECSSEILNQNQACHIIQSCQIIQTFSLTSKMHLYCQRQLQRVTYQTMFSVGSFLGLLCMNVLADTKGRRLSTILSLAISIAGVLSNIFGGIKQSPIMLGIGQLLLGFGGYSLFVLSCILLTDFCSDKFRQRGIILINASAGLSLVALGTFYLKNVSWLQFLSTFILIPLIALFLVMYFWLQQTPYILMLHNKKQQCLNMLKRLCKYNNRSQNLNQIQMLVFRKQSTPCYDNRPYLIKILAVMRQADNLKAILLVGILYAIGNIMYFGIEFTFEDQGYNYGINSIIIGSVQMISFVFLHYYLEKMSRTRGVTVFFGITAAVGVMLVLPIVEQTKIISVIIIGISRIFFTIGYTLIVCLQTESFGVKIQSTAAGVIQSISLLGVILAPGIVVLSMSLGLNPMVILSLLLILGLIPNKFIKQTNLLALNSLFYKEDDKQSVSEQLISVYSKQNN